MMEGVTFGRYRLLELLGRGGMAEVWKAKAEGPGGFSRTVVVKRILPHLAADAQFARMFEREARLSSQLSHANIVQVFEFGQSAGEPFLVMEYVAGLDLTRCLQLAEARGGLPVGLGPYVAREVARALGYAHTLRSETGAPLHLVHRDISPSNVLLGFDGSVKLLDFGIAKALAETAERTQTGAFKGKVGYASPEGVEGLDIDARADLFALGVVLHEALVGERLFKGESELQTLAKVREAKVAPPSQKRAGVPPALDAICLQALARARDQRFQTAAQLEAALDPVVQQLGFGASQLSQFLAQLTAGAAVPPAQVEHPSAPPRRGWRTAAVVAVGLLGAGLAALQLGQAARPDGPPREAPPPIAAPPPEVAAAPATPPSTVGVPAGAPSAELPAAAGSNTPPAAPPLDVRPQRAPTGAPPKHAGPSRAVPAQRTPTARAVPPHPQPTEATPKKRKVADVKGGEVVDPFGP